MKNFLYLLLVFIILSALFTSCKDSTTTPSNATNEIWPLTVGNSWTILTTSYYSHDPIHTKSFDTGTISILDKINIKGDVWFKLGVPGYPGFIICKNKADGFWINFTQNSLNIDSAFFLFKYPVTLGEKYYLSLNQDSIEIISLDTLITVPAGTFHCICYMEYDKSNSYPGEKHYFAPGIGRIKEEMIEYIDEHSTPPDTSFSVWELKEYTVK